MNNNQLLAMNHVEFEDNSIDSHIKPAIDRIFHVVNTKLAGYYYRAWETLG